MNFRFFRLKHQNNYKMQHFYKSFTTPQNRYSNRKETVFVDLHNIIEKDNIYRNKGIYANLWE